MPEKNKGNGKDVFTYIVLIAAFLGLIVYPTLKAAPLSEWSEKITGIIGNLCFYLFCVIGVFEFAYDNGLTFLVPNGYIRHKEHHMHTNAKKYIHTVIDEESKLFETWEEERVRQFVKALDLDKGELSCLRTQIIEARLKPIIDIKTCKDKLKGILFGPYDQDVIVKLDCDTSPSKSGNVLYYFRFADLMHIPDVSIDIANIMATFIYQQLKERLNRINVIMTPNNGNFLLGYEVSKKLGKDFIKMIPHEKIVGGNVYEGYISPEKAKDDLHIIIVHDVLFSGDQIRESMKDIRSVFPHCKVDCVFSLVYRKVTNALPKLQGCCRHTEFHNLLEYTEDEITQNLQKRADEA